jgi:hypothetical protein
VDEDPKQDPEEDPTDPLLTCPEVEPTANDISAKQRSDPIKYRHAEDFRLAKGFEIHYLF